jgi:hypothetical protein
MSMEEILLIGGFIALPLVVLPWLTFALTALFDGFPRLRLQQILGIVGVSAWVLAFFAGREGAYVLTFVSVVVILLAFAGMWSHEFRLLMLRRSEEFPDRLDKLAWVFVLTVMAPAGVWLFRSYRRARWPEATKVERPHPLDEPDPGVDVPEMQRIGA